MSRRAEGQLFVGRLSKSTRTRDLEDIFEQYGRLYRCELKYGAEMGYAFVDFEDRRDAEDALRYENGRDVCGSSIIVEWAKGNPRRPLVSQVGPGYDECYKCHRVGHWARDCPDDRNYGFRRPSRGSGGGRRSRSRSPRRRSRSRERRRRSRSRSRSRRRERKSRSRSRSRSHDRKRRRTRSRSASKSRSRSRSRSRSPVKARSASKSRSRSRSRSHNGDLQENGSSLLEQSAN